MENKNELLQNLRELLHINLCYWNGKPNFGDALSPLIVEYLTNIKVVHTGADIANMFAIGSILSNAFCKREDLSKKQETLSQIRPLHIYSSGFISAVNPSELCAYRKLKIHALRGKLSREIVEQITGVKLNCVLADAGLLAPLVINKNRIIPNKKYKLGIIPHHNGADNNIYKEIKEQHESSIIIDILAPVNEIIKQIYECEVIISTSLHGLIVADACGVPNKWCQGLSGELIKQQGFKFLDYYSSYNIYDISPISLQDIKENPVDLIAKIKQEYKIPENLIKIKQSQLLQCFPFQF